MRNTVGIKKKHLGKPNLASCYAGVLAIRQLTFFTRTVDTAPQTPYPDYYMAHL
jgi:hypothetical protein